MGTKEQLAEFEEELQKLVNRFSIENGSNTPDFVLAGFLVYALHAFDHAVQKRDNWYGIDPRPGGDSPPDEFKVVKCCQCQQPHAMPLTFTGSVLCEGCDGFIEHRPV
jgi:hypothetical protein